MKRVQVIKWLISHAHAARMMKRLSAKQHAHLGFYFELDDIGIASERLETPHTYTLKKKLLKEKSTVKVRPATTRTFSDYPPNTEVAVLTVYRDIVEPGDELIKLGGKGLPAWLFDEAKDARRELGKWLNEQPNREVDKRAIATLIAVFDAVQG